MKTLEYTLSKKQLEELLIEFLVRNSFVGDSQDVKLEFEFKDTIIKVKEV